MICRILFFVCCQFAVVLCKSQGYLSREISLPASVSQPVRKLLDSISARQGFYFSYSGKVVPGDRLVTIKPFKGTLLKFLSVMLGPEYEFKESPGYVIIRYAPRRLAVSLDVEQRRSGALVVEGQLSDALTGEHLPSASIYERYVLVSTLSDDRGRFRLALKRPRESIWLTVSKENYRDTTVALIPPVQVGNKGSTLREWFYPNQTAGGGLESSAFARFLAGSRQRIQALNLGGFFAYNPYQISLTPGLSSQGMMGSQMVNKVSVNVLGGSTAGVDGIEVGGVFNVNQSDVRYFQVAGLLNIVGRDVSGFQVAGLGNKVLNDVKGMQVAGMFNDAGYVKGMQVAGLYNIADKVDGIQLTSLVNVADSSDYPIGLINLIKQGRKSLALGIDESGLGQVAFRSGGRVLYGVVAVGHYLKRDSLPYGAEAGLGARLVQYKAFGLDTELLSRINMDFKGSIAERHTLRLLPSYSFGRYFALTGGPTVSYEKKWTIGFYGAMVVPLFR